MTHQLLKFNPVAVFGTIRIVILGPTRSRELGKRDSKIIPVFVLWQINGLEFLASFS